MNRFILALLFAGSCISGFSQDMLKSRLGVLGEKNYQTKNADIKNIKEVYVYIDKGIKSGIIVFTLNEIKMDVFASVSLSPNGYIVKSIEPVNGSQFKKKTMEQLTSSFSKWKNVQDKNIPDAVTSATRHSKGIYREIQDAMASGIPLLRS